MTIRHCALFLTLLFSGLAASAQDRPNILLIVADDLAYADLGVHGSIIRTPNIDALADQGILFTQFHAAMKCAITRAMLLTGNNNHVAGMGVQGSFAGPVINGAPGYENKLTDARAALLPQVLRDSGYQTYMVGKWHLGTTIEDSPHGAGFQRSFAMKAGAGAHFSNRGVRLNDGLRYWEDDSNADWPQGAYSTEFYTDKLISYIEEGKDSGEPFFAYAAYTSPHWPLQVPDEDLDLYAGQYEMGYDVLREQNFENLKTAGIIPSDSRLPPRNPDITMWDELSASEQRLESRKMELYASMVENLDRHVGRLVEYLEDNDMADDTLIVFMSDNGAAAEDFYYWGPFVEFIQEHYDDSYERAGMEGNFLSYGAQWAEAGSAPYRLRKAFPTEGGIVAPMIIAGNGVRRRRDFSNEYLTVMDLAPTILERAGSPYPDDKVPMLGESLVDFLEGDVDVTHDPDYVTTFAAEQLAYVRKGDWKLMSLVRPFDESHFELYNLAEDPGETVDLSRSNPREFNELLEIWRVERRRFGIILPEDFVP